MSKATDKALVGHLARRGAMSDPIEKAREILDSLIEGEGERIARAALDYIEALERRLEDEIRAGEFIKAKRKFEEVIGE
jgi:transcription elongation GreA/GreB family factor